MKNSTHLLLLSCLIPAIASAQSFSNASEVTVILKSDSSSKSVLVTNLFEDRSGYMSPFIGTAIWYDQGKQLQCHSLLSFDYGLMPALIKPDNITRAELILSPIQVGNFIKDNEGRSPRFQVTRVTNSWQDSMTNWLNQPVSNANEEVSKLIPPKKKERVVRIDVTDIVKNMFRYGNNGFMIYYKDSSEQVSTISQWFASARNENEAARPMLLLSYSIPYRPAFKVDEMLPLPSLTTKEKRDLLDMYTRPVPPEVTPIKN